MQSFPWSLLETGLAPPIMEQYSCPILQLKPTPPRACLHGQYSTAFTIPPQPVLFCLQLPALHVPIKVHATQGDKPCPVLHSFHYFTPASSILCPTSQPSLFQLKPTQQCMSTCAVLHIPILIPLKAHPFQLKCAQYFIHSNYSISHSN